MRRSLLIVGLLPLAGCHQGATVTATNASAEEVANQVRASGVAETMKPGRWEATVTVTDMKVPGLPPAQQAALAQQTGKGEKTVTCLTEADLKSKRGLFDTGDMDAKSCKYDRFAMGGGSIDAVMSCNSEGSSATMTMKGAYTADTMKMTVNMAAKGQGPMGSMTTTSMMDSRRVGECRGDEAKRGV